MLIQQLNRSDAERVFLSVRNVDGAGSLTTGRGVALVEAGASIDGNSAVASTGARAKGFCGVAFKDIAINDYGLAIAWGYAGSVELSQSVGSWTITRGDVLRHGGLRGTFTSVITDQALSTQLYRFIYAATTVQDTISNPRTYIAGIVRAL